MYVAGNTSENKVNNSLDNLTMNIYQNSKLLCAHILSVNNRKN